MAEVSKKDIEELFRGKTQEEINKMIITIFKDHFKELKEKIIKNIKKRYIVPMKKSNTHNIELIYKNYYEELPRESINLLNQANLTIKTVHILIDKKLIVDSNVLIRSAFEYLVTGMMIYFDKDVYKEFKKLGLKDDERQYTRICSLIKNFGKKVKEISNEMFENMSNNMIKKSFDDFYDKLCLFTHSSLIVNEMVEAKINNDEDFFIIIAKQNLCFLELLLYECLRYITKYQKYKIDDIYIIFSLLMPIYDIDNKKYTKDYLEKYNKYLYKKENEKYFEKAEDDRKIIKNAMNNLNELINQYPLEVITILDEIIKENK